MLSKSVFFTGIVLCVLTVVFVPDAKGADEFEMNRKLGRSVNIIGYDPIWKSRDQGRFKAKHFTLIKEAGFDSVRINLHAFAHMDKENNYQLAPAWLDTLDWAVKNALDNKLTVILDLHEHNALGKDPEGLKPMFLAFWEQIAPRFKDAPDTVFFEILNEPCRELTPELWNTYYRPVLAIIRKTNPNRTVIIGPAHFNSVDHLSELTLPEDDRNIIVTVHYYKPMEFTHQGARWTPQYTDKTGIVWPAEEKDKQAVLDDFQKVKDWSEKHNRPVLLGEFGAYDKGDIDSRVRYTSFIARTAEKFGFSWAYWQFDSDFIVYDIDEDRWFEPIRNALLPKAK